jgi:hypothetical protein
MIRQPFENPNQGELLKVETHSNGDLRWTEIVQPDEPMLTPNPATVPQQEVAGVADRRQRAELLLGALSYMGSANQARGFTDIKNQPAGHAKLSERYGEGGTAAIGDEMEHRAATHRDRAKELFTQAYRLGTQADAVPQADIDEVYTMFRGIYGKPGAKAAGARRRFKNQLTRGRNTTTGPYAEGDRYDAVPPTVEKKELPELNSKARLEALQQDERAGFLPATNKEKNQALELLDYIDNPAHPGGIYQRLNEIAVHNEKQAREAGKSYREIKQAGTDAVRSIVAEYGDYMENANASIAKLEQFKQVFDQAPNPALTLKQFIADEGLSATSANELIRYMDGQALLTGKELTKDPLRTRENRQQSSSIKNKTMEDRYTGTMQDDKFAEYIDDRLAHTRLVTVRVQKLLPEAIEDQQRRAAFWHGILADVRYTYRRYAEDVLNSHLAS